MSIRARLQSFGGFLTAMVIPNIGVFIAWGLLSVLFAPTGLLPNEHINKIVAPFIQYLFPLLIAYTSGKAIGGQRGAVMGAIATMGIIISSDIPMLFGAMIMGPTGGYIIKKFDKLIEGKVPSGFEMIVNNFSIGILGMVVALLACFIVGPVILFFNGILMTGINALIKANLLPLLSIINEPAKVLFLNNAIDQGIYLPIGVQESAKSGQSILFMVASSPGPGLGLLLAFALFGKGVSKKSAPSAMIIHFFGGVHELYFPYLLMKPKMIIPMIAGGMSGIFTFQILEAGLAAFPSPGSLIAFLVLTPKGEVLGTVAGVLVGAAVSFLISSLLLKLDKSEAKDEDFENSKNIMSELQESKKTSQDNQNNQINSHKIDLIAFACDAGMGSSAMGSTVLQNKFKKVGIDIKVIHCAVEKIPKEASLVICHNNLLERAKRTAPNVEFITITNYINAPEYDLLIQNLLQKQQAM